MKRCIVIVSMLMITMMSFAGIVSAEEAGCFQTTDNWIIRVYSEGALNLYSLSLAVLEANGSLVPASQIDGLRTLANPYLFEDSATKPDLSLGCDTVAGTAYIVHDHAGQLTVSTIPHIAKYVAASPVLQVTPAFLAFGRVTKGTKTLSVIVTNTGTAALHISSVTAPSAPYSKATDTCTGATVAPTTGTCSISIKFAPLVTGSYPGSFTINSDGGNTAVQLTGSK
jgi:hypothetical protein